MLAEHPSVLYDTSAFSAIDVVELFARVPAERIVFASDSPYGHPLPDLYLAMRAAARAGVDAQGRAMIAVARWPRCSIANRWRRRVSRVSSRCDRSTVDCSVSTVT